MIGPDTDYTYGVPPRSSRAWGSEDWWAMAPAMTNGNPNYPYLSPSAQGSSIVKAPGTVSQGEEE